jgi:uncharacterized membrane protein
MAVVAPLTVAEPVPAAPAAVARPRLDSIDLLRGLVMVIMALDHVRDFLHRAQRFYEPTNLARTTPVLFFTRWITHFCAPTFIFLAGVSAYLWAARGRTPAQLTRFLLSRGFWLVLVELTIVKVAWTFNFSPTQVGLQVIWVIGWSMVVLALLVRLPLPAVATIGVVMIAGHNLLDGIHVAPLSNPDLSGLSPDATAWDWIWSLLHVQSRPVIYPLIPWAGVMAAGYAFGPVMRRPEVERRRVTLLLGLALTAGFIMLRAANVYGDPSPWSVQRDGVYTLLSFLNTTKYPPSLLYLLMTLGPALVVLALVDRASGPVVRFFVVYGRVPFLYYVAHLYLIHVIALVVAAVTGQVEPGALLVGRWIFPKEFGIGLGAVYLIWIGVVLALYPLCRWFAALKARRKDAWLSYI